MGFVYGVEPGLSAQEFRRVLVASGLSERRPAEDLDRLERMLRGANLILTARAYTPERTLVGVARTVTDFAYCAYVADLAVARAQHGHGIGRALIDALREKLGPEVMIELAAAPGAEGFYERIGMTRVEQAFRFPRLR